MPSDTAMISASVLDLELSLCTLELAIKYPTPNVIHVPEVDRISFLLANAASIDTVTWGGRVLFNLSGTSRTDFAKLMALSSFPLSSVVGSVTCLDKITPLCSPKIRSAEKVSRSVGIIALGYIVSFNKEVIVMIKS